MKYREQKFTASNEHLTHDVYFYNTPISCIIGFNNGNIYHSGLNLTEGGEWIPAPGFGQASTELADALAKLKKIEEWADSKTVADSATAPYEDGYRALGINESKHAVRQMLRPETT